MAWTAPRTWAAGETLTAALLNTHLRDNLNAAFPVGSLHYFIQAGTTTETTVNGFALECNEATPLRATYSALNTLLSGLSYPFGSGNGTTTFNLPNLAGRALWAMAASGHTDVNALGDSDGLAKASRSPQHNSTNGLSVGSMSITGSPAIGTLAVSGGPYVATPSTVANSGPGAGMYVGGTQSSPSLTGSLSKGSLAVSGGALSGTIGPGGTRPTDTVPFLVAGVWAVKY